jgi:hypothetical protein
MPFAGTWRRWRPWPTRWCGERDVVAHTGREFADRFSAVEASWLP